VSEQIKLYHGDCLEIMRSIPDRSVDLCLTDPPYKVITGGTTKGFSHKTGNIFKSSGGNLFEHHSLDISLWAKEIFNKLKDDTHAYFFCNSLNMQNYLVCLSAVGFKLHNILVWKKNNKVTSRQYMKNCEYIIFCRKGKAKTIRYPSTPTVLEIDNIRKKTHPTEKPVDLVKILMGNSSCDNHVVLDPFMGTGSAGVAAKDLNRKFIGIEKDEKYFNIAKDRIDIAQ
jgi:site-specific DNA-methyltransferase (adenine-specific)